MSYDYYLDKEAGEDANVNNVARFTEDEAIVITILVTLQHIIRDRKDERNSTSLSWSN